MASVVYTWHQVPTISRCALESSFLVCMSMRVRLSRRRHRRSLGSRPSSTMAKPSSGGWIQRQARMDVATRTLPFIAWSPGRNDIRHANFLGGFSFKCTIIRFNDRHSARKAQSFKTPQGVTVNWSTSSGQKGTVAVDSFGLTALMHIEIQPGKDLILTSSVSVPTAK